MPLIIECQLTYSVCNNHNRLLRKTENNAYLNFIFISTNITEIILKFAFKQIVFFKILSKLMVESSEDNAQQNKSVMMWFEGECVQQ